jgi:hypothetical protein
MTLSDVESLLEFPRPKVAVITHMGNEMLDLPGGYVSRRLSTERTKTITALDGMTIDIEGLAAI